MPSHLDHPALNPERTWHLKENSIMAESNVSGDTSGTHSMQGLWFSPIASNSQNHVNCRGGPI